VIDASTPIGAIDGLELRNPLAHQELGATGANGGSAAAGNGEPQGAAQGATGALRPRRTVLVLGGGGMRGFCHIGVIRAIERLGLQIDEVVGTSMGAVMGALFASGMDSRRIEEVAGEISIKQYFRLNLLKFLVRGYRHASVYKGRTFQQFLQKWLPQESFESLSRGFYCNALSLTTGASRFFGLPGSERMPVADAVYASACLPTIFEPAMIGGDHYVDGGMTETLALRIAHARSADLIIGVDLSHREVRERTPYKASLPHILFQTYEVMGQALNEHNLHRYADDKTVILKPKVSHLGLLDMPDVEEIVRIGEQEAVEVLTTNPLTRYLCDAEVVAEEDRKVARPRDYVQLDVDMNACIHCGICAATCATQGFAAVPLGDVVKKLHNYECTHDMACERNCPTGAIRLGNL